MLRCTPASGCIPEEPKGHTTWRHLAHLAQTKCSTDLNGSQRISTDLNGSTKWTKCSRKYSTPAAGYLILNIFLLSSSNFEYTNVVAGLLTRQILFATGRPWAAACLLAGGLKFLWLEQNPLVLLIELLDMAIRFRWFSHPCHPRVILV